MGILSCSIWNYKYPHPVAIYPFIYVCMYSSFPTLLFILTINIYYDAQIVPGLVIESPSVWHLCPFGMSPSVSSIFLLSSSTRYSRLILDFLKPGPKSAISLRSLGRLRWKMVFISQDQGTRCVHCYKVFKLCPWREVENVCFLYITYTQIIYLSSIYLFVSIYLHSYLSIIYPI